MKTRSWSFPETGLFAVTRVALGIGIGLLLSERLEENQRRAAGTALVLVGLLTTVPFAIKVLNGED